MSHDRSKLLPFWLFLEIPNDKLPINQASAQGRSSAVIGPRRCSWAAINRREPASFSSILFSSVVFSFLDWPHPGSPLAAAEAPFSAPPDSYPAGQEVIRIGRWRSRRFAESIAVVVFLSHQPNWYERGVQ